MTEADISAVADMWIREGETAGIELPRGDIEMALRQLPTPAAAAVGDDATTLFVLGQADVLFTLSATGGKVTVVSRPLNAEAMSVTLEWDEPATVRDTVQTRATRWTFSYGDQRDLREPWQHLSGSVSIDRGTGDERPGERERFARLLAARAGWAGHADAASEEPSAAQQAASAERDEPWWRARTDVWGKPLKERRP